MLLHVVAPARGVDAPRHAIVRERAVEHVQQLAGLLDDGDDGCVAEGARVPRLAAALGVEGRAVQHHRRPAFVLVAGEHGGVEVEKVRVGQVEALAHGFPRGLACATWTRRSVRPTARGV